ncbi:MAG: hypothetical protein E7077_15030 [Bacteroidales bacterium]|jgi:hypothetical protein|nr:hypothetical protein [Bacteroidales bacterium]
MNTVKFLLFTLISVAAFSSCEDKRVSQGRDAYMRFYKNYLPNPNSLKVKKETYTIGKRNEVKWILDIQTNDIYGNLTDVQDSFITTGNRVFKINEMVIYDDGKMNRIY